MRDKNIEGVLGIHTAISLPEWVTAGIKGAFTKEFLMLQEYARFKDKYLLRELLSKGLILDIKVAKNIIVADGLNVSARLRSGDNTYSGHITHGALGNGVSPVFTSASHHLVNEVGRIAVTDDSFDGIISYHDFFFELATIANGTYTEWMTCIDGTVSANSGQAYSLKAPEGGWVKAGALYVSSKYTGLSV